MHDPARLAQALAVAVFALDRIVLEAGHWSREGHLADAALREIRWLERREQRERRVTADGGREDGT